MTILTVALAFIGALVLVGVVLVGLAVALLPSASAVSERARVEREAQEASWRIHQRASEAFAQMLDVARQHEDREESS